VETSTDILEEIAAFQSQFTSKSIKTLYNIPMYQLEDGHQKLLECIGLEATSIDTLVARTGLSVEDVASTLTVLEMSGHVNSTPCGYSRVIYERRAV
jgi:predicted Rossmann fold nucleotide-binding protein DprA/Smf involved in DNA uptake